jgi:hypothetical protein
MIEHRWEPSIRLVNLANKIGVTIDFPRASSLEYELNRDEIELRLKEMLRRQGVREKSINCAVKFLREYKCGIDELVKDLKYKEIRESRLICIRNCGIVTYKELKKALV